jgi:hypothetical protein
MGRPKYRNRKVVIHGFRFASKREANRYLQLYVLQSAGEISGLRLQPEFELRVNGRLVCKYIADFEYTDAAGNLVLEDAKGVRTEAYRVKKKLFEALTGRVIVEV